MRTACADSESRSAYETGQSVEGDVLRPGGLELTAHAIHLCGLTPGARVLDIGCGSGASVRYLRCVLGFDVVGVDISASACKLTSKQGADIRILRGGANCLPIASESMDAVLAECSLSLMKDKEEVLAECFRVLAAGGRLVITDMYARNPGAAASLRALPNACVSGMIVRQELEEQLAKQDFLLELWEDHADALEQLLFRFVMGNGDLEQLWNRKCTDKAESERIRAAMRNVRPGYFLLVASKEQSDQSKRGEQYEQR